MAFDMHQIIDESLKESLAAKQAFAKEARGTIITLVGWMVEAIRNGKKILIFGNGGSAADAQHMAAEFVNRFLINRRPLPAIALTTDSSILTSIGNDFSFDDIFLKQIQALGQPGDVALGISTSGNSPNVLKAIEEAKAMGLRTVALTGGNGGKLLAAAELTLNVPSKKTPAIQETHLWVEHLLCQLVDEVLFGQGAA
ncbi:MAG TPA: D-sedoheptulose 7-phosphate isomerase [Desulfurivibrionaceae bacterium]|nr:D-sedoheptulose 7-phosphate isomerase [Desulfurivibrionaceae bacterium]